MAYFDNAATTFPKPACVYDFMDSFYRNTGGSFGRGEYGIAQSAKGLVADTRSRLQQLLHCPAKQVVFEPTATIALNIIIQGIIAGGVKTVYISPFEHNAVTRTLHYYESLGQIKIVQFYVAPDLLYDMQHIRSQFEDNAPDCVILSHASNVIGLIAPIKEICELAKQYKAVTVVDMAQTAGLIDCDLGLDVFDFAVFAGHKTLMGPTGISGFVMKPEINLPPVLFGGTGFDSANQDMPSSLPERFEMGTLNISGIAGLNAALRWIEEQTLAKLKCSEDFNRKKLLDLLQSYDFISIIGNEPERQYVGIVSCVIEGISSDSAGQIFSERNVAVRTGLHCASLAHRFLGTYPSGTIRFSVNYFTTEDDFIILKNALDDIQDNL